MQEAEESSFFFWLVGGGKILARKMYRSLIKKQPQLLQKVDDNGETPLHHAVVDGYAWMVGWLAKQDKSAAFVYDNEGYTPLLRAASLGKSGIMAAILDVCPQSAKLRDLRFNRTALHLAKMANLYHLQSCMRIDVIKQILNETDIDGNTALHCAIIDGDVDKGLCLLDTEGINWTIRNNQQKSPQQLCVELSSLSPIGAKKLRPLRVAFGTLIPGRGTRSSLAVSLGIAYDNLILSDENLRKMLDNIAVAAALLVTITFAAAFTVPGGYDPNTGEVMAMKKASIRVFIASDILAMLMAISILIWYTLGGRRTHLRKLAMNCIMMLLISLVATIVAFISGVFAIGWHVKSVVIVPLAIAAFLNLFFIFRREAFEFFI